MFIRLPHISLSMGTILVLSGFAWTQAAEPFVVESTKRVPVAYDVDVVVAGGGIAGTVASISATRQGAKTL